MDQAVVISIGNYDGVHLGHQALLAKARALADQHEARVVIYAFENHPLAYLNPAKCPPTLTPKDQRAALLQAHGADEVAWLDPTPNLLKLTPSEFIESLFKRWPKIVGFVEGNDFHFGKGRAGNLDTLRKMGETKGFAVHCVNAVDFVLSDKTTTRASSTLIRWLLAHGRARDAALALGRPYALHGPVVQGAQMGRKLGFPTANLHITDQLLPRDGVYAGYAKVEDIAHPAAISIGTKPTLNDDKRYIEAYLLNYSGSLYGKTIEVGFEAWLRDQMKFNSIEQLKEQITFDVSRVNHFHPLEQV